MPRRCSILPLMASVGPLEVRGWSKYAAMSSARLVMVLARVRSSLSPSGMLVLSRSSSRVSAVFAFSGVGW
jgi:hypothetical protein